MTEVAKLPSVVGENWDWQVAAACRGMSATTFFNPDNERGRAKRTREAGAKAICATCPVIAQCLGWALSVGEPYGIWGGKNPGEREALIAEAQPFALAQ